MSSKPVTITAHASQRMTERLGIPPRDQQAFANAARKNGKQMTAPLLNPAIRRALYRAQQDMMGKFNYQARYYRGHIWVFNRGTLITVKPHE